MKKKKKKEAKNSSLTLISVKVQFHRHSTLTEQKLHGKKTLPYLFLTRMTFIGECEPLFLSSFY